MVLLENQSQKKFPFQIPERIRTMRSSEINLGTVMSQVITTLRTSNADLAHIIHSIGTNSVKIQVEVKGKGDFASTADKLLGGQIMRDLRRAVRGAEYLVEDPPDNQRKNCIDEDRERITSAENLWVVDPLCGSTNFIEAIQLLRKLNDPESEFDEEEKDGIQQKIPTLLERIATGIAFMQRGKVVLGAVLYRGDIYFAYDGQAGAWCLKTGTTDPIPLVVNDETNFRSSVFTTGSKLDNWDPKKSPVPVWFPRIKEEVKDVVTDTRSPLADAMNLFRDVNHAGVHGVYYPVVELVHKAALWQIVPKAWISTSNRRIIPDEGGVITNGCGGNDIFEPGFCATVGYDTHFKGLKCANVSPDSLRRMENELNIQLQARTLDQHQFHY